MPNVLSDLVVSEPLTIFLPRQAPPATHLVAFTLDQVRVAVPPREIFALLTLKARVGAGTGVGVVTGVGVGVGVGVGTGVGVVTGVGASTGVGVEVEFEVVFRT